METFCGAEDGTRTRDPNLGKVMLYQLSYFRSISILLGEACLSLLHCKGNASF